MTKRGRCGLIHPSQTKDSEMEENKMENEQKNTEEVADEKTAAAEQTPAENAAEQTPEEPKVEKDAETAAEQLAEEPKAEEKPAAEKPAEPNWKENCARLMADFDNYRKRMARDREDLVKSAAKDVVQDILATVDNLARALDGAKDKAEDPFVQGVKLVYDGLLKALEKHGATPIDSVGEPFNADYHEAVAQLPSQDVEEGVITNEVLRGWLLHGKLLRAAKVVVSAGKGA